MLEKYINILKHNDKQVFIKQQVLKFYVIYIEIFFK